MKIKYFGNFGNPFSDSTEEHIKFSLEKLGHEVVTFDERDFDMDAIIKEPADLFLFHKGGVNFGVELPILIELLNKLTCKKVYWYFDKVNVGTREIWNTTVIPFVDAAFITDGSWIRRQKYDNVHWLMQGIGDEDTTLGKFSKKYECDVAFTGSVYGTRTAFLDGLEHTYGDKFKHFQNVFGRELYDLCASAKILIAPVSIQTQYYWSSRVYMTTGSGGFMLHPRFEGLKTEFEFGKELATFLGGDNLKEKIDYYLHPNNEAERKSIQKAGYEKTINNYTYTHRIEKILKIVNEE